MSQKIAISLILLLSAITIWMPVRTQEFDFNEGGSGDYNGDLDEKTKEHLHHCEMNQELMELCMRCAKITKSTFVYPLCCGNEDNIMDWCHSYVFFGVVDMPPKPKRKE